MSNFQEEEKFLSEFDELQIIIDMAQDTKIDLEYPERNIWEKLKEKKDQETKEREERECDIQREMEEGRWNKGKEFELELKLKVEMD